jgi:hypothetical protein
MKTCFNCGTEKPLDDFYRHPTMKDGRLGKCKECTKADVRANYAAKRGQYQEYGKGAGPRRNKQMIEEGNPDLVIAFPGGRGTADMINRARAAGVRVIEVQEPADAPRE